MVLAEEDTAAAVCPPANSDCDKFSDKVRGVVSILLPGALLVSCCFDAAVPVADRLGR